MFDKYNKDSVYFNDKLYEKNTPLALRARKQFVCWKWEWKVNEIDPSKSKWIKVPKDPNNGLNARSNDKTTWSNFDTACRAVDKYKFSGIGVMFHNSLIGIDLDDVVDNNYNLIPAAEEIIRTLKCYTELSPSGNGVHILAFGDLEKDTKTYYKGKSFEIYSKGRYFTLTGKRLPRFINNYFIRKKTDTNDALNKIFDKYFKKEEITVQTILPLDIKTTELGSQNLTDNEIIKKCIAMEERKRKNKDYNLFDLLYKFGTWENDFESQNEADYYLCSKICYFTDSIEQVDRMFRQSGLMREKWDRKQSGSTYGIITIKKVYSKQTSRYFGN